MFEHLDDPNPPEPDRHQRDLIGQRARVIRHRRRRRATTTVVGAVALGAVGLAGFASYDLHRLDKVRKVAVATQPAPTADGTQTVLLVGTDRDIAPGSPTAGADTIAAVRLDADNHQVTVLQIPRDLSTVAPQTEQSAKLTDIFRAGGAGPLVEAVQHALGISIQHYVQIDPSGFLGLADAVGGADVAIPDSTRDTRDGLSLPKNACSNLTGESVLALARARSVEVQINGTWTPDTTGDLGRMARQNALAKALLSSFRKINLSDPSTLHRLVGVFSSHVTVDKSLDADQLIDLGRDLHAIPAGGIATDWLPLTGSTIPSTGASSLSLGAGWQDAVNAFERGLPSGTAPSYAAPGATPSPINAVTLEAC